MIDENTLRDLMNSYSRQHAAGKMYLKVSKKDNSVIGHENCVSTDPNVIFVEWDKEIRIQDHPYWDEEKNEVVYKKPIESIAAEIVGKRNALLNKSDWVVMPDSPFTKAQKDAWKEYRQALRDITKQEGFPENVVFPEAPV